MDVRAPLGSHPTPSFESARVRDAMPPHRRGVARAVVVDDIVGSPVGVLSTLDIAGILGWGRA